jgi:mutator protein MutT
VETIEVTAAIIRRGEVILIAQRLDKSHLGGLWEFPGGKREAGESLEACLERECAEELGVTVKAGELVRAVEHSYPERRVMLYFFECRLLDGEPQALGCKSVRWVRPGELSSYRFPPADATLIEDLVSGRL